MKNTIRFTSVDNVFTQVKSTLSGEAILDSQLEGLHEKKTTLREVYGKAWEYLTDHKDAVLKAGYASATDAVNKVLGDKGANRFFNGVNAFKKAHAIPVKGNGKKKTVETAFSRLVKKVKGLSLSELQDLKAVIDTAIHDIDTASAEKQAEKTHGDRMVDAAKGKAKANGKARKAKAESAVQASQADIARIKKLARARRKQESKAGKG